MKRKIIILKIFRNSMLLFALFSYYFQCPFAYLSRFIIPFTFAFILLESNNLHFKKYGYQPFLYFYIVFLNVLFIFSILKGTELSRILRFYLILLAIPICFAVKDQEFEAGEKLFIYLAFAKSVMLIGIAVWLLWSQDYEPFRNWARIHNFGDIYILQGIPRVQVKGNALLLVAFMLDYLKKRRLTISSIIVFLGILAAGNFAFILGLGAFFGYRMVAVLFSNRGRKRFQKIAIILFGIIGLAIIIPYANNQKVLKSAYSNKVRIEQAKILLDTNILTGNGLGYSVTTDNELLEKYNNSLYYEMQTFYIFNQIGLLGIIPFYIITLWPAYKNGKQKFWIYLIYLFYSFWNPYCFDTTQMLAIIAIVNFKEIHIEEGKCYSNCILSIRKNGC